MTGFPMSQDALAMVTAVEWMREYPHAIDDITARMHIARATLLRWDAELLRTARDPFSSSHRRPGIEAKLQSIELFVEESAALLRSAGHYNIEIARVLDRRWRAHRVWIALFNALFLLVVLTPALLILAAATLVAGFATSIDGAPFEWWMRILTGAAGVTIAAAYFFLSGSTLHLLFGWMAPFRKTIAALTIASDGIEDLGARDPFRAPRVEIFRNERTRAASLRRRVQRNLLAAERQLTRKSVLGSGYATTTARNLELQARGRAAATLAWVETSLVREGRESYDETRRVLRQLTCVTLLRDWSIVDLPRLDDAADAFRSLTRRLWVAFIALLSLAGSIITVVVAVPAVLDLVRGLPPFP